MEPVGTQMSIVPATPVIADGTTVTMASDIMTPPARGTVRGRSSPPGMDGASAQDNEGAKRRGVIFMGHDNNEVYQKVKQVHDFLLEKIVRLEGAVTNSDATLNKRIDELATMGFTRRNESVAKFGDLEMQVTGMQLEVDILKGETKGALETRLQEADK